MKLLLGAIYNNFLNCLVFIANLFIWRNRRIWLFGAWFGQQFSDNSRFLFQYLNDHKEQYHIKKVIWVTRNKELYLQMKSAGYEVYMMHSRKSFYYHLKAGVHVLCNNASFSMQKYDIMTQLSFGAKKIQLWHGVGIKACGRLKQKRKDTIITKIYYGFLIRYIQPGMWGNCYFLATGEENKRVVMEDFAKLESRIIMGNYPRLLGCDVLFPEECEMISNIQRLKQSNRVILYLPTFRDSSSGYVNPCSLPGFEEFLRSNHYIWIQKKHSADQNLAFDTANSQNIISLDCHFDVNLLYDYIDLLITDYSSASSDAIYKNKMTLAYCSDFEYYVSKDRGFVNDFDLYHVGPLVTDPTELLARIKECISLDPNQIERHYKTKNYLFGNHIDTFEDLMDRILETIYKKKAKK